MTRKGSNHFKAYCTAFIMGLVSLSATESQEIEVGKRPIPQDILEKIFNQEEQCPTCTEESTCTFNNWSGSWTSPHSTSFYETLDFEPETHLIRLTDGSQWKVSPSDLHKLSGWKAAQPITIEVDNWSWGYLTLGNKHYIYRLVNATTGSSVEALLYKGSNINSPQYRQIEGLLKSSLQVSLNDGSTWAVSSSDYLLFQEWVIKDTVVIGSVKKGWFDCCNNYHYILINVDSNHFVRAKKL